MTEREKKAALAVRCIDMRARAGRIAAAYHSNVNRKAAATGCIFYDKAYNAEWDRIHNQKEK